MKITIIIDAPDYIGGIRYIERFIKILSLTKKNIELNLIYVNCKNSIDVSIPKTEKFIKIPNSIYRLDRLLARFTGFSFFSLYMIKSIKNGTVFFSDIFLPKFIKKQKKIQLIHWFPDFQVYDLEHLFPFNKIISRKLYIKLQLRTSDYLLTQSDKDKERMKIMFPKYSKKIIKWSFAEPVFEVEEPEQIFIKNYELKRKGYLLYPHQGWAHKNHLLLIKTLQFFTNETLVLTGRLNDPRNESYTKEVQLAISNSNIKIVSLGLVSSNELNILMKNAKAILNFSSYEGWSSCVEEGIMLNVPLILSNIPIHKEQCKEALFIDISNLDSAKKTLETAFTQIQHLKNYNHTERTENCINSLSKIVSDL
jgi:glycosyltransferase involved in cell wall biosynthesis